MTAIFLELTLVIALAGGIATAVSFLKQPPIMAYIVAGLIVGPLGMYQLHNAEVFQGLGQVGITLLLFLVGLELDISQLKKLGLGVLAAGIGQIAVTFAGAFAVVKLLGFAGSGGWMVALGTSFSSTVITVKMLTEKRDLSSLYGKISLGILLLQDVAAISLLIFLAGSGTSSALPGAPAWESALFTFAKAIVLVWLVHGFSIYAVPRIMRIIGKSDELILVFSLSWALGLAVIVSLPFIGFSLEIGGFLAGLALAHSAIHYEIGNRIKTIRDFFIIIFFIILGAELNVSGIGGAVVPALILAVFIVLLKPFAVTAFLGFAGYKPRTSFMAGTSLGHISEFSLILGALGVKLGYISQSASSVMALAALASIVLSSYMTAHAEWLYRRAGWLAALFDVRKGAAERAAGSGGMKRHVIVVGAHRLGRHIVAMLHKMSRPFIVVDHNPEVVEKYHADGVPAICGDINDAHIQELAGLAHAKLVISTVPAHKENLMLINTVKSRGSKIRLIMVAEDEQAALELYGAGIDYALLPHFIGGQHLAHILEGDQTLRGLKALRAEHLESLNA